ncbi:1672_t:CDS:2, partial [Racocetra persica]
ETRKMLASGFTSKVENMIQDLTDSLKKMSLNLVQQDNKKEAYTIESSYNPNNQNQDRNRKINPNIHSRRRSRLEPRNYKRNLSRSQERYRRNTRDYNRYDRSRSRDYNRYNRNRSRSQSRDWEVHYRSSIRQYINLADNKETISTNHWNTLLNNTSIREALANYLQEGQPIVSKVNDYWEEEYEDEELISYEAYTLEAESNNIEDSGWTIYQRKPKISCKKN